MIHTFNRLLVEEVVFLKINAFQVSLDLLQYFRTFLKYKLSLHLRELSSELLKIMSHTSAHIYKKQMLAIIGILGFSTQSFDYRVKAYSVRLSFAPCYAPSRCSVAIADRRVR